MKMVRIHTIYELDKLDKLDYGGNVEYYKYVLSASIYADTKNEYYPYGVVWRGKLSGDDLKKFIGDDQIKNGINKNSDPKTQFIAYTLLIRYI